MENRDIIEIIQDEIDRLDVEEEKLEMELKDVLTDVSTPATSEDEDEEEEVAQVGQDPIVELFKRSILSASVFPTRICEYIARYQDPRYRRNALKKSRYLKKFVKTVDMDEVMRNPRYLVQLNRMWETYPDHGGRELLNELIAVYCLFHPWKYTFFFKICRLFNSLADTNVSQGLG